jgi:hypothetical protein
MFWIWPIRTSTSSRRRGSSPRAPGSGKTNLATLLVQSLLRNGRAGVILDPKPSEGLAHLVTAAGGIV